MRHILSLLLISFLFLSTAKAQLTARMLWDSAIEMKSTISLTDAEKTEMLKKAVGHDSLAKRYFFTGKFLKYGPNKKDWDMIIGHTLEERLKTTYFIDINGDGLPDIINYGFNLDNSSNVTYIFLNKKDSFSKIFDHKGLPTAISFDKKGNLKNLGLYMHFCCNHGFDYIYSFGFRFGKKKSARVTIEDTWYTIHFENDKPSEFNMDKKAALKSSFDVPSYYPNAIPFPKGEARDAMVTGRIGLKAGTPFRILYKTSSKEGDRYFIEAPFPESLKNEARYKGKGPVPTKFVGWITADELK